MTDRILIIRLGALGDLVLCFEAFQAIRNAHPKAEIALLTMPAFENFAKQMPWFDRVLTDPRAPRWNVKAWWNLIRQIRAFAPTRVYDLQGKHRQTILYNLLGGPVLGPEWSGAAPFCSHPRLWPPKPGMHFTDFIRAQLERADIPYPVPRASNPVNWLSASLDSFNLSGRFALLIPGCAPNRAYKRWPAEKYAELADRFQQEDITSIAIGTSADESTILEIAAQAPHLINLCGQTSLAQVAELARRAVCVVGNDTGPTHLAAAVGGKTLALMSDQVDPVWSCPKGAQSAWLQGKPLSALAVEDVFNTIAV